MTYEKIIGAQIRTTRNDQGLTQEQAAHDAGMTRNTWGSIERGDYRAPNDTYKAIFESLGKEFNSDTDKSAALKMLEEYPEVRIIIEHIPLMDKEFRELAVKQFMALYETSELKSR